MVSDMAESQFLSCGMLAGREISSITALRSTFRCPRGSLSDANSFLTHLCASSTQSKTAIIAIETENIDFVTFYSRVCDNACRLLSWESTNWFFVQVPVQVLLPPSSFRSWKSLQMRASFGDRSHPRGHQGVACHKRNRKGSLDDDRVPIRCHWESWRLGLMRRNHKTYM